MARKLTLALDELRVDSFDAGGLDGAEGTVYAQSQCTVVQSGCNPDVTLVNTGTCCPGSHGGTCNF
jgi:hypothetical protein